VRADRLLSLVLLLQARGRMPASALAAELEVSVRTVYRDLTALSSAGVPVRAESGPGGGCELLEGYRFPLRGLRPDEAEALLILGVPRALGDLGLDEALTHAHRHIRAAAGTAGEGAALVHLDMPRWFGSQEEVPHLGGFWGQWSAEFEASRPRLAVTVRDAPQAIAAFPEIFGSAVPEAGAPDEEGWRVVTLTFEHELAAGYRLAGFGGLVQVLEPARVRERLLATAQEILRCYGS
jgi:predicted DNA-binding transcriptional regulator YafY